jgi:hypothetical protein
MNAVQANRQKTATEYPMKPVPRSAVLLSIFVVVSAAAASLITLVWRGSFPDPSPATVANSVLAEARGWSAATLLVAIPLVTEFSFGHGVMQARQLRGIKQRAEAAGASEGTVRSGNSAAPVPETLLPVGCG